jgi:hypothetical protein
MHIPERSRARKRLALIVLVPLAIIGALLLRPPIAFAGTYTVHTCETPEGTFTSTAGWTSSTSPPTQGHDPGLVSSCTPQHASMRLQFSAQMPVASGQDLRWSFVAPASTHIASLFIQRTFQLGWPVVPGRYGRPYVYESWHDSQTAENQLEFELPPYAGDTAGVAYPPTFSANAVSWRSLHVSLSCWPLVGSLDCGPFPAQVTIARARIGLADASAPGGFATGGTLTRAGPVRGSAGLSIHAFDAGGGVYRVALAVDGEEVSRQVLDSAGGSCADVEPANADPHEFGTAQPCPLSADATVQLDTTAFDDGQHTLRATVEDAAGNATTIFDGTVQTHNAPINAAAPALSGQASVNGTLTADTGQWDGAPTGFDHRWLRCDADGAACTPIAGATGNTYAPADADAYHRLRVDVTAENGSGAASARSTPSAIVADAAGRTSMPAAQAGQHQGAGGSDTPSGGIQGIVNPLGMLPGHVANGVNATTRARMEVAFQRADGSTARRIRLRAGRRIAIVGRLTGASGAGIAGARIGAAWRIVGRGWVARPGVRTGQDGRFVYVLPPGPSRDVRFTYFAFSDSRAVELSNVVRAEALAPLTIRADRRRVTGDRIVRLSGRVGARTGIPRGGLLVTLQGFQHGYGWRTFSTVRTDRRGRWSTSYRFRSTHGRFGFRALVPRQGRFPFASSRSSGVFIVVS